MTKYCVCSYQRYDCYLWNFHPWKLYLPKDETRKLRKMGKWYSISIKMSIITNINRYGICSEHRYLYPSDGQCRQHWQQLCQKRKYLWVNRFGVFLFLNETLCHSLQNIIPNILFTRRVIKSREPWKTKLFRNTGNRMTECQINPNWY